MSTPSIKTITPVGNLILIRDLLQARSDYTEGHVSWRIISTELMRHIWQSLTLLSFPRWIHPSAASPTVSGSFKNGARCMKPPGLLSRPPAISSQTTFASATAPGRNAAITQLCNIFKDYRPSAHAPVRRIRAYNALQVLNSGLSVATQLSLLKMSSAQDSSATSARRALKSQLVSMETNDHELAPNTGQLPDKFQMLRKGGGAARAGLESEPEPFEMVTAVGASGDAEA